MAIHPLPGSSDRPPVRVGRGIDRVVASLGMPTATTVRSVFGNWPDVVGEELASRCQPVGLRDGVLTVAATDQAWATELRWMASTIVDRCAAEFGNDDVQSVRVTVSGQK